MTSDRRARTDRTDRPAPRPATGWGVAVRLAVVVSAVAALLVAAFAGQVAGSTLICAVIAGGSVVGWISAERAPVPSPIRLRRR